MTCSPPPARFPASPQASGSGLFSSQRGTIPKSVLKHREIKEETMPATLSTAQTYRDAAKEHLRRAQDLFDNADYFLAHYLFGLAVECHLRAYLRRATSVFDSGHDLRDLAAESGFYDIVPRTQVDEFSRRFSLLNLRWRSNQRYSSERQLWGYMSDIKADFGMAGNSSKNQVRTVRNLAHVIINQGEAKWDSR